MTTKFINPKNLSFNWQSGTLVAEVEASEIGMEPGKWPDQLESTVGNGQSFVRADENPGGIRYNQIGGCMAIQVVDD
jgi:hypothetical protein